MNGESVEKSENRGDVAMLLCVYENVGRRPDHWVLLSYDQCRAGRGKG